MIDFLIEELPMLLIERAIVFGSFANGKAQPRDLDLLIVVNCYPNDPEWQQLISKMQMVKENFKKTFTIPLNTLIYTMEEFKEASPFKQRIFNKNTIILK